MNVNTMLLQHTMTACCVAMLCRSMWQYVALHMHVFGRTIWQIQLRRLKFLEQSVRYLAPLPRQTGCCGAHMIECSLSAACLVYMTLGN